MATKIWVGTDSGNEGDYGVAANWSPSGVPIAGDDVFFLNSSQDVTGSLDQSAVALNSFQVRSSYTGEIATESTFLQVQSPTVNLGKHIGSSTPPGSGRINLDLGSLTAATIIVESTKTQATNTNRDPVRLLAANAATTIFVKSGKVGVADNPDQSSTISSVDVTDGTVNIGDGVTVTTITVIGGTTTTQSTPTTLNVEGGTLLAEGTGAITTANVRSGTFTSNATGTITTLNALGGTADFQDSNQARTVTTLVMSRVSQVDIDTGVVTLTNDVQIDSAEAVTLKVS